MNLDSKKDKEHVVVIPVTEHKKKLEQDWGVVTGHFYLNVSYGWIRRTFKLNSPL